MSVAIDAIQVLLLVLLAPIVRGVISRIKAMSPEAKEPQP